MGRSKAHARLVSALALAAAAVALSCQLLVPLATKSDDAVAEDASPSTAPPPDGRVDASPTDPCFGWGPEPVTGTSRETNRIVFAIYQWRFEDANDPAPSDTLCGSPGFDLDQVDTRGGNCTTGAKCAPVGVAGVCDLQHGVDDSLSHILTKVRVLSAKALPDAGTVLETGTGGLILQLDGYNGQADDEDVQLTLFAIAGIDGHVPDAGTGQVFSISNLGALPPVWDAGDKNVGWLVDERSYTTDETGLARPADTTFDAYVRDNVLVANLHEGTFPLGVTGVPNARYTSGRLLAKLRHDDDGRWRMIRGRVGVRLPSGAMLTSVAAGHTPTSGGSGQLCLPTNKVTYDLFRAAACEALDLPADEKTSASAPCSEMSAGFTFAAIDTEVKLNPTEPGKYAAIRSVFGSALPCPDGGTYVCDSCEWAGPRRCGLDGGVVDGN